MSTPILVAGDSYSTDWPKQFQKLITTPVVNISSQGRSNLFIWSSTINYLLKNNTKHIVIVGNSFVSRTENWVEKSTTITDWDGPGHPERNNGNKSIPLQLFNDKHQAWFRTADICTLWQQYYLGLFCFAHTLKSLGHNFFFFNAANNTMGEPEIDDDFRGYLFNTPFYIWSHSQPNILPGDTFSIPSWCKENNVETTHTGHIANDEGCLTFSKWLHQKMVGCKLL